MLVHFGSRTSIEQHSSGLGYRVRRELHPPPAVTLRNSAFGHTMYPFVSHDSHNKCWSFPRTSFTDLYFVKVTDCSYRCRTDWSFVKVKFTLKHAIVAVMVGGGAQVYLWSFFNLGAIWVGLSAPRPVPFYRRDEDPVPNGHCTQRSVINNI